MNDKVMTFTAAMALWADFVSPYSGPFALAVMAALARMAYSESPASFHNFIKFFCMAFFISLMAMYITLWQSLDKNLSIAIGGFCAFLSEEIFAVAILIPARVVPVVIKKYLPIGKDNV